MKMKSDFFSVKLVTIMIIFNAFSKWQSFCGLALSEAKKFSVSLLLAIFWTHKVQNHLLFTHLVNRI